MAAQGELGMGEGEKRAEPAARPRRKGVVERCQPLLPVASVMIPLLGAFGTVFYQLEQIRSAQRSASQAQQQVQTANWLSTLQKVGFEEANLIPTALLMSNFDTVTANATDEDRDRAEQARRVERIVLEQTGRPRTFDVVVSDMLGRSSSAERVGELMEVVEELDGRLQRAFRQAVEKDGGRAVSMEAFLADPAAFYKGAGEKAQLEHVLSTMWELDTISDEMTCAVRGNGAAAPVDLNQATFLNYAPAAGVKAWRSCKVEADDGGAGLDCVAPEGAAVPDC